MFGLMATARRAQRAGLYYTRALVAQGLAPFRADQVGSFLRPPALLAARHAYAANTLSLADLRQVEDHAIDEVLDLQQAAGIDVLSDGEFRRAGFVGDFTEAVDGFEALAIARPSSGYFGGQPGAGGQRTTQVVVRRLQQQRRLADVEAGYLRAHAPGPFKITLPTPFQFANYVDGVTDQVYATRGELLLDLAAIVAGEVRALIAEGVTYIQIDAPRYSYFIDPRLAAQFKAGGADPSLALAEVLAADNQSLGVERPAGVITAIHLCRGNNRSTWYAEGGYDAIAEQLFATLQADRFLLEYDDDRSGSFEPLRFVPPGKTVVLGLVTSKFEALEDQAELLRRIDDAARYVPLEQLALSPQCGFASLLSGNVISPDAQWRKLELVADTARKVWG
jgi:5-methyltetrahydropteroyltriglutamate--homocysteine methyltransferase